jgi:hypothetical protein
MVKRTPEEAQAHIKSILAETVHVAFRKGCDGGGSHEVWDAIGKMRPEQWSNAIGWMLWALDYSGIEVRIKPEKDDERPAYRAGDVMDR